MVARRIQLQVDSSFSPVVDQGLLFHIIEGVLDAEGVGNEVAVSLVVTDEATVHRLNREYRGRDEPTDVLSFPLSQAQSPQAFPLPPGEPQPLGEVIISYHHVVRQAQALGHPEREELARLVTHGLLHLHGYEHEIDAEAERMEAREEELLSQLLDRGQ